MPRVLITQSMPSIAYDLLKQNQVDFTVNDSGENWTREELLTRVADYDAIFCVLADKIDREMIARASQCRIFANYAVGYNNIDVTAATEAGIYVSNTPDVLTDATADIAWLLMLSAARRVIEGDTMVRAGKFSGWQPLLLLGADFTGKTLGIVGAGRIGQATARRAMGFGMKIIYYNRSAKLEFEKATGARQVDLDTLLQTADYISLHVPLHAETHHLIGADQLAMMKPSAILINTARGAVIDESALAKALAKKEIRAAGLDVYEQEPLVEPALISLNNVVLLPHLGSATEETRTKMAEMAIDNILATFAGKTPPNCLNPEAK